MEFACCWGWEFLLGKLSVKRSRMLSEKMDKGGKNWAIVSGKNISYIQQNSIRIPLPRHQEVGEELSKIH